MAMKTCQHGIQMLLITGLQKFAFVSMKFPKSR